MKLLISLLILSSSVMAQKPFGTPERHRVQAEKALDMYLISGTGGSLDEGAREAAITLSDVASEVIIDTFNSYNAKNDVKGSFTCSNGICQLTLE